MKNLYLFVLMLVIPQFTFAQFSQMRPGEEADQQVLLIMNDNTSRTGNVKNNKADKILFRILSQDAFAFRHAPVEVDVIQFKPEGKNTYEQIPAKDIKKIVFSGEEPLTFDRISVYKFKRKNFEIKRNKVSYMFAVAQVDDVFKVYNKMYLNRGSGGAMNDMYMYFAKLQDSDETYFFKISPMIHRKFIIDYFKVFAPNNEKYTAYIDKFKDEKSPEYAEFQEERKEDWRKLKAYMEENKKNLSWGDERYLEASEYYNYMFYFIGKKYKELVGTDN